MSCHKLTDSISLRPRIFYKFARPIPGDFTSRIFFLSTLHVCEFVYVGYPRTEASNIPDVARPICIFLSRSHQKKLFLKRARTFLSFLIFFFSSLLSPFFSIILGFIFLTIHES